MATGGANLDRVPGLRDLQADALQAPRIAVAVIDGPIDLTHAAFAGANVAYMSDRVRSARVVEASRQHGTHVASILFGRPDGPVAGVAPFCRGLLISVFSDEAGGGVLPCSEATLARAILLAADQGANVINISAGRLSGPGTAGSHLNAAIRQCIDSGILIVAAAGNDGCDCLQVPAALPGVLAVGAHDARGEPGEFSNWGAAYRSKGVLAPGTDILGADPVGGVVRLSGTSFATPMVAGAAALLMAKLVERGEPPDGRVVMQAILDGADACDPADGASCDRFLAGTLNVTGALAQLLAATSQPDADRGAGVRRASFAAQLEIGRNSMEHEIGGQAGAPQPDAAATSMRAMADALRAMQDSISDLGKTLGTIRTSGLPPTSPVAESRPGDVIQPAVAEARQLPAARPFAVRRRSSDRSLTSLSGELITPAACCDACAAREARQLVYALGSLHYDFGTEARMDSIQAQLQTQLPVVHTHVRSVLNPHDLVMFLKTEQGKAVSPAINWTLVLDETPIYAIRPEGDYVEETYQFLVERLGEQAQSRLAANPPLQEPRTAGRKTKAQQPPPPPPPIERMSLPGVMSGEVELMNGLIVPTVRPALAGMFMWNTADLVKELIKLETEVQSPPAADEGTAAPFDPQIGLWTFLSRIYEELRNVGLAPQDRALNYAATNAYQVNQIFAQVRGRNIHIEKFEVTRSPVMRPDSDCWDVKMTFFNPTNPLGTARDVYFYTIDVSDVVPVPVGRLRHWTTY